MTANYAWSQALDDITERKQAEEALAYRLEAETLVAALSSHFINVPSGEVDREIWLALERVGRFTAVDRAYLMVLGRLPQPRLVYPAGKLSSPPVTVERMYEWCADDVRPFAGDVLGKPLTDFAWTMDILQRGETLSVFSLDDLPPEADIERQVWSRDGLKSLIGIPLMKETRLYAVLGLDSLHEHRAWQGADIKLVRVVGEIFLNVLTRRQAELEILTAERFGGPGATHGVHRSRDQQPAADYPEPPGFGVGLSPGGG